MHKQYVLPAILFAALASGAPAQISVDVDLVVLEAAVRDRGNHIVSDLREQDFAVYEDRVRQTIKVFRREDVPVTVGLIIDHSGSMRPKLGEVTAAARAFVRSSNPEDQMFVVNFNEKVTLGLPAGLNLTNQVQLLQDAIGAMPAVGQTALYDAVIAGLDRSRAGGPDKKVLVVISDGGDNASAHRLGDVLKKAARSNVIIYAVGIFGADDPDRNPAVLRRLADTTGGETFLAPEPDQIAPICERIARDVRNQYTIGYLSTGSAPSGVIRKIRVSAAGGGHGPLSVRTRSEYSK